MTNKKTQPLQLIRVPDAGGAREYDLLIAPPAGMPIKTAVTVLSKLIRKVKKANPEGFTHDDLKAEMDPLGFTDVKLRSTKVEW